MPTTLPVRRHAPPAAERRVLLALTAVICGLIGLALAELAFTDTSANAEVRDPFSEIAEY